MLALKETFVTAMCKYEVRTVLGANIASTTVSTILRRSCGVRGWLTKGIENYSADLAGFVAGSQKTIEHYSADRLGDTL